MLIMVKPSSNFKESELKEFEIKVDQTDPPIDEVLSRIVHECATKQDQRILPCTFLIQKGERRISISVQNLNFKMSQLEVKGPITIEICSEIPIPSSFNFFRIPVPHSICPTLQQEMKNPLPNIEKIVGLLQGVTSVNSDDLCGEAGEINDVQMQILSLVIPRTMITSFDIYHHGITDLGASILLEMLQKNRNLKTFTLGKSSLKLGKQPISQDTLTNLIRTAEYDKTLSNFSFHDSLPASKKALTRKKARLGGLGLHHFQTRVLQDLEDTLLSLPVVLVQLIHAYLCSTDFTTEDLNSALLHQVMPQVPWEKLNEQNEQGEYTITVSTLAKAEFLKNRLMRAIKGLREDKSRKTFHHNINLPPDYKVRIVNNISNIQIIIKAPVELWLAIMSYAQSNAGHLIEHFDHINNFVSDEEFATLVMQEDEKFATLVMEEKEEKSKEVTTSRSMFSLFNNKKTQDPATKALSLLPIRLLRALRGTYSQDNFRNILKTEVQQAAKSAPTSKIYEVIKKFYQTQMKYGEIPQDEKTPTIAEIQGYLSEQPTTVLPSSSSSVSSSTSSSTSSIMPALR